MNALGTAIFFKYSCAIKSIPTKSSIPTRNRANHSATVQFKKLPSTIIHPNCSSVGSFEIAEKIKTTPTAKQSKVFIYCLRVNLEKYCCMNPKFKSENSNIKNYPFKSKKSARILIEISGLLSSNLEWI